MGLNPCFNGRCTRTPHERWRKDFYSSVLILVLMEDALALKLGRKLTALGAKVLILVLMEDALALTKLLSGRICYIGLNPCFNGRCTRTSACWRHP